MFTGIIEALGAVRAAASGELLITAPAQSDDPWRVGESVAVNGCCLTVSDNELGLAFNLSEETRRRTALGRLKPGDPVNLERAVKAGGRFGGHIVQGHVDGVGALISTGETEHAHVLKFSFPSQFGRYLIEKGSIAIEGVSLTVTNLTDRDFEVWVIPHTWENTSLSSLRPGDEVNMEFDVLAKYVEKLQISSASPR